MVVCGVGAAAVSNGEPTVVEELRLVRTSLAMRTAPSMFNSPAPCSSILEPASGCAVYIRIILIMFGVSFGFASNRTAIAPATMGAETEVPLRRMLLLQLLSTQRSGFSDSSSLLGAAAPMILFPGATRSGLIK